MVLAIVLHDAWFYWTHRLMHHPRVFRHCHRTHHLSMNPTPWAAFAFHPVEAAVQAAIFPLAVTLMPMHPLAFGTFMAWQMFFNVLGHTGYEITPRGFMDSWLRFIINTPTNHTMHHEKMRGNFGLYFNFWDRLMRTNHDDYEQRFREVTARHAVSHATGERATARESTGCRDRPALERHERLCPDRVLPLVLLGVCCRVEANALPVVQIKDDAKGFVLAGTGTPFVPWGLNYGNAGRLIEDFWESEWATIDGDFVGNEGTRRQCRARASAIRAFHEWRDEAESGGPRTASAGCSTSREVRALPRSDRARLLQHRGVFRSGTTGWPNRNAGRRKRHSGARWLRGAPGAASSSATT